MKVFVASLAKSSILTSLIIFTITFFVAPSAFCSDSVTEPSVKGPDSAPAGAQVEISFEGAQSDRDFISIVSTETKEGKYGAYVYTKKGPTIELAAPEESGAYEIRMISGESGFPTLASSPLEVTEVTASVSGPDEIAAGAKFEITWEGPNNRKDFITLVEKGTKEGKYQDYKYTHKSSERNPLAFEAPVIPGEYELRYLTGNKRFTLASHSFSVTPVTATVSAPTTALAGSVFEVEWTGPDNHADFITIVEKGTKETKYGYYKRTSRKQGPRELPIVELKAPEELGEYEVRYLTGRKYLTLASTPITVTGAEASLKAQNEVVEGSRFDVEWTGPGNSGDFINIVPVGEKEGKTGSWHVPVSRKQGPRKLPIVSIKAPEELGEYEVRYVTAAKRFTLASIAIKVIPSSASIDAPEEAIVRDVVEVSWEGPDNDGDYITLVKEGADDTVSNTYAKVRRGKILRIKTPLEAGPHELRYITGQKKRILARKAITIIPSKVPGEITIVADQGVSANLGGTRDTSVALILDASGSMLKREKGTRRIEIAKKAVGQLLGGPLAEGTPFSMRVFGHKEADSCRTDLEIPLAPLDRSSASKKVQKINAMNHAKTPIARSLELAKEDLETAEGRRVVILVTDGEETCEGDPQAAIRKLADSGFDTRINIIGFAIEEYMLKETFQKWATLGNGKYFDATNAEELEKSIVEATQVPYEVLDTAKEVVASGVVNGESITVLPGTYTVRVLSSPEKSFESVVIEPEKLETLKLVG